ncbi:MAG: hypothetical protein ABR551_03165 [Gemmatimonadales bacterium]
MQRFILAALVLGASVVQAQGPPQGLPSPAAAQRVSLLGFLVPVAIGTALTVSDDASDGAFVAGAALLFGGTILGPAVGYWRGGAAGRGWLGAGIRTGVLVAAAATLVDFNDGDNAAAAGAGLLIAVGHAVYDVVRVRAIVTKRQASVTVGAAPGWVSGSGVGIRVGW